MYQRMYAALGDPKVPGLGAFRKRFIQVWVVCFYDNGTIVKISLYICWLVNNSGFKMSVEFVTFSLDLILSVR